MYVRMCTCVHAYMHACVQAYTEPVNLYAAFWVDLNRLLIPISKVRINL